ncbi:MAG: methylated-DNA--[protein]-cysteine S-methyltransferase [Halobacteriovoraceae bacterium]|nr:methylated-DNA--[protein]-cysteine S-methyltransferase [Halobacteriovoraceae bacterium]
MVNKSIKTNKRRALNSTIKNSDVLRSHLVISSPIGKLLLEADEKGITALQFLADEEAMDFPQRTRNPLLTKAKSQVLEFLKGKRTSFNLPLNPKGTEFQKKVWNQLSRIPYGETKSYGQVARLVGNPSASRAVGGAANSNPLLLIVPCHRLVGSTGSLTGFACGVEVKKSLLELEGLEVI